MAKKRTYKTKRKPTPKKKSHEEQLVEQLYKTLGAFFGIIILLFITFRFFGPKVGYIFSFLSKNRNEQGIGDIIPPPVPIFSDLPEATNKDEITLNGLTEPGATVDLLVNGPKKATTTADSEGHFTFADIKLSKGKNIITSKATDDNNNTSENSRAYYITFDDKKPEIEITEPENGSTVKNLNRRVMVKGTINEKATVKINDRAAIVSPDNEFELLLGVDEGDVEIKIKATDTAGNEAEEKIYIKYKKES